MFFNPFQKLYCISNANANPTTKSCLIPNSYHCYCARRICSPTKRFTNEIVVRGNDFKFTYALPLAQNIVTIDTAETSKQSLLAAMQYNEKLC